MQPCAAGTSTSAGARGAGGERSGDGDDSITPVTDLSVKKPGFDAGLFAVDAQTVTGVIGCQADNATLHGAHTLVGMAELPIHERLKGLRKSRGWAQSKIAERLAASGIDNAGVGMVETGRRAIPLEQIPLWLEAYGTPTEMRQDIALAAIRAYAPDYISRAWAFGSLVAGELTAFRTALAEEEPELAKRFDQVVRTFGDFIRALEAGRPAGRGG